MEDQVDPDPTSAQETSTPNIVILQKIKLTSDKQVPNTPFRNNAQMQKAEKILPENASSRTIVDEGCDQQVKLNDKKTETKPCTSGSGQILEDVEVKKPIKIKKPKKVPIFTEPTNPVWHKVRSKFVTQPIISTNLPKAFKDFPIFGKPRNDSELAQFQKKALQEFVGSENENDLELCSTDLLLTGQELKMDTPRPVQGLLAASMALRKKEQGSTRIPDQPKLITLQKLQSRLTGPRKEHFKGDRKLKYRAVRLLPLKKVNKEAETELLPPDLDPGVDVLFRVRVYRTFTNTLGPRYGHNTRGRQSVFNGDVVILGRQFLWELRDRIVCRNEMDLRMDISSNPTQPPPHVSMESFPSNFMFINGVFYMDTRHYCRDVSAGVRRFARDRGIGEFRLEDMCRVTIADLKPRLAYPEVYCHQGNCEHVFQFSEVRVLSARDPLHLASYPATTAVSQHQTLYCNTCADFAAKWIVTHSRRIPFDPAFFCDTCFYSYMYVDGTKVENFWAYQYKGNEVDLTRPGGARGAKGAGGSEGAGGSGDAGESEGADGCGASAGPR